MENVCCHVSYGYFFRRFKYRYKCLYKLLCMVFGIFNDGVGGVCDALTQYSHLYIENTYNKKKKCHVRERELRRVQFKTLLPPNITNCFFFYYSIGRICVYAAANSLIM